jgi:hypothetical protein
LQELGQSRRRTIQNRTYRQAHQDANRKIPIGQHPQVDDRICDQEFPNQKRRKSCGRTKGEPPNKVRRKPVIVLTLVQHDL